MPPSTIAIHSPYDVEAHYSNKRSIKWVGYKVHMTEICDEDSPRFITNVHTTLCTITDEQAVEPIHSSLQERDLLPDEHLLDAGYPTAENLVNSKTQYNIEIIGPVRSEPSWQTKAQQGFDNHSFKIDWEQEKVTCPQGQQSVKMPVLALGGETVMRDLPLKSMQLVAENVRGGVVAGCGHWIASECSEDLAQQLLTFFGEKD